MKLIQFQLLTLLTYSIVFHVSLFFKEMHIKTYFNKPNGDQKTNNFVNLNYLMFVYTFSSYFTFTQPPQLLMKITYENIFLFYITKRKDGDNTSFIKLTKTKFNT